MRRSTMVGALAVVPAVALLAAAPVAQRYDLNHPDSASISQAPAPQQDLDDPTIVAIFDATNTADIETGGLAAERGSTKAVRDFGAMLARDHESVRQLGRDLAKKLGVTPTPPKDKSSAKAHAQAMATLRAKHGAEFDRAFLQHEIAFHQSVIDAIQATLLPAIQNEELKALVIKIAPAFEAHMRAAQQLLEKQTAKK